MKSYRQKTAPSVKNGRTQRKNRWDLTPGIWAHAAGRPLIERQPPGEGSRHYIFKRDVEKFIELLPDWSELSRGLNLILLATGNSDCMGWHRPGIVAICADQRELVQDWNYGFFLEHREILERLDVRTEVARWADDPEQQWRAAEIDITKSGAIRCHFTPDTMKAFQLLHILLHELGHHHDRMTTRSQVECCRGERYAEDYAIRYADKIWDRYFREFRI